MPDLTFEQFEDLLEGAKVASLQSLGENERQGGEPYSPQDILKAFIEKVIDDLEHFQ